MVYTGLGSSSAELVYTGLGSSSAELVYTGPNKDIPNRTPYFSEDVECAEHILDLPEKCRLWGDIAAAAESGRDFSSRWFQNDPTTGGSETGKMGSTRTSSIIPVDLNAIICGNLRIFAEFYEALGDETAARRAIQQYNLMRETIHQVLWNEEDGCWFDFDISNDRHINVYHDTNFFPLFTGCTHDGFEGARVVEYLTKMGVLAFPGGLPSSLIQSGQQWDFPNAWAPTTWVIIQTELARIIAEKWIQKNYVMWKQSGGRMFEKYNVASACNKQGAGGGGEYEVQEGFGWTNGVILDLLITYQSELIWNADLLKHVEGESPSFSCACECCQPAEVIFRSRTASMSEQVSGLTSAMRSRKCSITQEPIVDSILSSDLQVIPEHSVLMEKLSALATDVGSMAEPAEPVVETFCSSDLHSGPVPGSRFGSRLASRKVSFSLSFNNSNGNGEMPSIDGFANDLHMASSRESHHPSPETLAAVAQMMAHAAAAASLNPSNILIGGGEGGAMEI